MPFSDPSQDDEWHQVVEWMAQYENEDRVRAAQDHDGEYDDLDWNAVQTLMTMYNA